jgi:hypothetical protein
LIVIGQPGVMFIMRGFLFFLLLITTFVCCVWLSCKMTISISMHREVGRWWRGLPVYRFASLGAAESRGNKAGATVIQSKDALGRDIECLSRYQMTGAQTGIAQCNQTEKVPRCGYSMSYRTLSISSPMTPCGVVTFPHLVPSKFICTWYLVFQGSSYSLTPDGSLAFCSLTAGFQVSLRMALRSTKWYLLRVALYCMPRTVPKI